MNSEGEKLAKIDNRWIDDIDVTNADPSVITVGGIDAGTTFDKVTFPQFVNMLLYPELFPDLTSPSLTSFVSAQSGYREIGETVIINFFSEFNRGEIDPAYGTSGFRSGLPNQYTYTGAGIAGSYASTSLTDARTAIDYIVVSGVQNWTCTVSYDAGEQPLSSKGNNYDSPLPAGDSNTRTVTVNGVYPWYATTSAIGTLTKQSLTAMNSSYVQASVVAEDGVNKQTFDFPDGWSAITGIQFYNTVSSAWEWIGGSKANSLTTFTATTTSHTVQGNSVNYDRYTHNGSTIGARQLRFYTT